MMAQVDAEGKALDAECDVLLDGCVDALTCGDVEVGEIVLGAVRVGSRPGVWI